MQITKSLFLDISKETMNFKKRSTSNKKIIKKFSNSKTIYIGNLSYHTKEEKIWNLFFKVGKVKRIIMGLNRFNLTPCGFCFLEYFKLIDAQKSVYYLGGFILDNRKIKIDLDSGFSAGRQFGRGKRGGQKQDDKPRKKKIF